MKLLKWIIASLLRLSLVSVLFLGSCVGPAHIYAQSSKWFLKKADIQEDQKFFVAFIGKSGKDSGNLRVVPFVYLDYVDGYPNLQFHLPEERMSVDWNDGHDGGAEIRVSNETDGSQRVRVFVVGDTPWTSHSEYLVKDNVIYPLLYGDSGYFIVQSMFLCIFIILFFRSRIKPIGLGMNRLMRTDCKK
jgi:hypothetical protein